jgi:RNA polymerase sigma-70 factor (ECF subfamily)
MPEEATFADLIRRARGGDDGAAAELVRRYEPAVRRAVRLRLDPRLRRSCDSLDICQAVLCSFFVRVASGQYDLETPDQLLKLLATMAHNKLGMQRRYQRRARRDERRVVGGTAQALEAPAVEASPSRQVSARELLAEVRRRLSADERRLADWRAEGRDWADIASTAGGTAEALRKKLARALARVADQLGLEEEEP